MGGLFAAPRVSATTIVRTITADATAKTQRLATARSYSGYLVSSVGISAALLALARLATGTTIFNGRRDAEKLGNQSNGKVYRTRDS